MLKRLVVSSLLASMIFALNVSNIGAVNSWEWAIEPVWDYADSFSDGFAMVRMGSYPDEKYGFIDSNGNIIVEPVWDYAYDFSEGLARVRKDGKYGFIDSNGNVIIEPVWDYAYDCSEGVIRVMRGTFTNPKYGFINSKGNVISEPIWDFADSFSGGFARVSKDGKYGFIRYTATTTPISSLD